VGNAFQFTPSSGAKLPAEAFQIADFRPDGNRCYSGYFTDDLENT
jgi:hypothetical protein